MTTNRRAEDFDRALAAKGHVDPTMAALVAVAGALAAMPQKAAPAFRESLRATLMAEAASLSAAASVPAAAAAAVPAGPVSALRSLFAHPAMQAATGTLAATVAATGVGIGASRSLPGDSLYGLKRTVERWQVGLAGGAVLEAEALLEHANTRLDEVRALLERGGADTLALVRSALEDLNAELADATSRLLASARDGSRDAYDRLNAVVADVNARLVALLPSLPTDARAAASKAMNTLNVARAQLLTLPVPPRTGPTPTVPVPTTSVPSTSPPSVVTPPVTVTTPPVVVTTPPVVVTTPPIVITTPPPVTVPPVTPLPTLPSLPITLPPV